MSEYYISHFGILGMKWGVQNGPPYPLDSEDKSASEKKAARTKYRSTGLRAYAARKSNEKVDKPFNDWRKNTEKRADAIELGKKSNEARLAYERSDKDKDLKRAYKQANKEYKNALRSNTIYRQGQIKGEVGHNLARKHLTEAKRVEKELKNNPDNKDLQKKYAKLMSKHDVERAAARKAPKKAEAKSRRRAAAKRALKMSVKAAAVSAAAVGGDVVLNKVMTGKSLSSIRPHDFVESLYRFKNLYRL